MTVFVEMKDDLDAAAMEQLRPRFEELATSREDVEIDLSSVRFIDSSGVGGIVYLYKRLTASGVRLVLTGANDQPRDLLDYVGVLSLASRSLEEVAS